MKLILSIISLLKKKVTNFFNFFERSIRNFRIYDIQETRPTRIFLLNSTSTKEPISNLSDDLKGSGVLVMKMFY